jgi:hypothetical protein
MRCISLWQPWAQWVALGWKTIETRSHNRFASLVGQRIAIHAAQKWDHHAWDIARSAGRPVTGLEMMKTMALRVRDGAVLCTVDIGETTHAMGVDERIEAIWARKAMCPIRMKHLLFLGGVQRVQPVVIKGHQGIFEVPGELIEPWRDGR